MEVRVNVNYHCQPDFNLPVKLTIVIVNYNVRYFLEQCLLSVQKAMGDLAVEVFVVDNASVDGSVEMVREKFPWVQMIANSDNPGFSKANNQAMRIAKGEYILLLNPDTVVQEDTFRSVVSFMDEHPQAGGLGVKMMDGKGRFLPESKRGLPTPETSFYKIFGLNALFPGSGRFNRYYLGNLSNDETHEIEILSGAFMLMRKKALDEVGLLDEAFFMYGEDIDLSWRIIQGGWKNYYFPQTRIIHYKGESTKKGSLNYVFVFYNAMVIFARKHFSEQNARIFSFFIHIAIWMRAGLAILMRFLRSAIHPFIDGALTFGGLMLSKNLYAATLNKIYDDHFVVIAFLVYSSIWVTGSWIAGGYDRPLKPLRIIKPVVIGTAMILILYSLLPETMRFSRALILFGAAIALPVFVITRILINLIREGNTGLQPRVNRKVAVVGSEDELVRVKKIIAQTQSPSGEILHVNTSLNKEKFQLDEIVRVHDVEQVIFCARDISSADIISAMSEMDTDRVEFKIAPPESLYIIGSGSIETTAEAFMLDINSVSLPINQRLKRSLDVMVSLLMIPLLPLLLVIQRNPAGLISNMVRVLFGSKSWVGLYFAQSSSGFYKLPRLKKGVLTPRDMYPGNDMQEENIQKMNIVYARDYRLMNDLFIIGRNLRNLGRNA
jgi:O-antigen biosynthesis protein